MERTYTQLLSLIRTKLTVLDTLAEEAMDIEWVDKPDGQGSIHLPYVTLLVPEKQRLNEIEERSDQLHEEVYQVQLVAEELLDDEQLDRLRHEIGEVTWDDNRTMYMPMT